VAFTNVGDDDENDQDMAFTMDGKRRPKKYISHITCHKSGAQMLMAGVVAGEFDKDEGFPFSFCHTTGPPEMNYKKVLLKSTHRTVGTDSQAPRSVFENSRSVGVSHIMKQSNGGCIDPN
jgi:hypothetical protein